MTKARPRTIRLDEDIDKALDAYIEQLKKTDGKANYNSVINEFCGDRLILGRKSISDQVAMLEVRVSSIEQKHIGMPILETKLEDCATRLKALESSAIAIPKFVQIDTESKQGD